VLFGGDRLDQLSRLGPLVLEVVTPPTDLGCRQVEARSE
jgi:hypothetical protein